MIETEWFACEQPGSMLGYLHGKVSDRQLRLFAVACCCRLWYILPQPARGALAVAESFADGQVSLAQMAEGRIWSPARRQEAERYLDCQPVCLLVTSVERGFGGGVIPTLTLVRRSGR